MSAKLKLDVDPATAKMVLDLMENMISSKRQSRDELSAELETLENGFKSLREQLSANGADAGQQPRGDNRARIREYLSKISSNKGARASQITKDTGIGVSSTAYTLKHYDEDFVRDEETKRWRLKNATE